MAIVHMLFHTLSWIYLFETTVVVGRVTEWMGTMLGDFAVSPVSLKLITCITYSEIKIFLSIAVGQTA